MKWDRRSSSVRMVELFVGATLPNFGKPQGFKKAYHLMRF